MICIAVIAVMVLYWFQTTSADWAICLREAWKAHGICWEYGLKGVRVQAKKAKELEKYNVDCYDLDINVKNAEEIEPEELYQCMDELRGLRCSGGYIRFSFHSGDDAFTFKSNNKCILLKNGKRYYTAEGAEEAEQEHIAQMLADKEMRDKTCSETGCRKETIDGSRYCYYHKCRYPGCGSKQGVGGYCSYHLKHRGSEVKGKKSSSKKKYPYDEYSVYDYDDPYDFYEDNEEDFDGYEDAEEYWEDAWDAL